MRTDSTFGRLCKAAANDNARAIRDLTPVQTYAVRTLASRARISMPHALLAAQLAGIIREGVQHD